MRQVGVDGADQLARHRPRRRFDQQASADDRWVQPVDDRDYGNWEFWLFGDSITR